MDISYIKTGNITKLPIRYILPKNFATKHLVDGDIVVEISGGSPSQSTGRVALISQELLDGYDNKVICTNFCRTIKLKTGYSMFVYHYWDYLYNKDVFFAYENGTTGIKNLDITSLIENYPICIPPLSALTKFNEFCQVTYSKIFSNGLEIDRLISLRDILLPQLMSGEADISNIRI
jgi:hypothetical protein